MPWLLFSCILGCLASACQRLPTIYPPVGASTPAPDALAVTVTYGQWFTNSSASLTVNEKRLVSSLSSLTVIIKQPTDGNVTVTTSNPLGIVCTSPAAPIKVADAQQGINIPCVATMQLYTQQPAAHVLAQPDLNTATAGPTPLATDANLPWGLATERPDNPNWLFVVDQKFNRVLGFALPITQDQVPAAFVLGQAGSFTGTLNGASQTTLSGPLNINSVSGTLVVTDSGNNRVLLYHAMPADSNGMPDTVVGQNSFASDASGCDAGSLQSPYAALIAGSRLYVADAPNNRVLMWLNVPQAGIAPAADAVIGQAQSTNCGATSPPTANTLSVPRALHWDGNYFFIGDSGNNRILVYQGLPDASSSPGWLIGQPSFTSNADGTSDTSLNTPKGITSDANTVFVADTYNSRVFGYYRSDILASSIGSPPHPYLALGQVSTSGASGNDSIVNVTAMTLDQPAGLLIVGSQLFVSDTFNRRVLIYDSL